MDKVKIEAFLSVPPCSGGISLSKLLDEVQGEFGDRIEVVVHKGPQELAKEYNLTAAPALVVGGLVKMAGLCPSKETLITAIREAGLE